MVASILGNVCARHLLQCWLRWSAPSWQHAHGSAAAHHVLLAEVCNNHMAVLEHTRWLLPMLEQPSGSAEAHHVVVHVAYV